MEISRSPLFLANLNVTVHFILVYSSDRGAAPPHPAMYMCNSLRCICDTPVVRIIRYVALTTYARDKDKGWCDGGLAVAVDIG